MADRIRTTQREGAPRDENARCRCTLDGISAKYVYEVPAAASPEAPSQRHKNVKT
ncbi:hypothetical protein AADR41_10190 [Streptomyces sp. CLV115]|uniref:hypothetical protein n=1 Tax=Streptomyces sp. CLV115 TaxID=3138502 RepID=UPI00313CE71B